VCIDARGLSPDALRDALAALSEHSVVARARELARALANYGGTQAAADAVLSVR
jgi:hypothetical protein